MSEIIETYEVQSGAVVFTGRVYFKVEEVREPSHPLYPGLVFEGHYFDTRRQVWAPRTTLSAQYGLKWRRVDHIPFPDKHLSAYLEPGMLAVIENYANGLSYWSPEVKCKVIEFGRRNPACRSPATQSSSTGTTW
ncbi:hypothetical protein ACR6C2_16985 [Streptomyces sp. INA 01156]